MKELPRNHDAIRIIFIALMLVSPVACASDFRGFITIFIGFPSIIFCDLALGWLLMGFYLGVEKFRALILLPFFVGTFLLFLWITFINGSAVVYGFRQGVAIFIASLASLICSWVVMGILFLSFLNRSNRYKRRKVAAWAVVILATITSLLVAFDFCGLLEQGNGNWTFVVYYSFFFGLTLFLHVLIMRLSTNET
jgi:hypothetical protein